MVYDFVVLSFIIKRDEGNIHLNNALISSVRTILPPKHFSVLGGGAIHLLPEDPVEGGNRSEPGPGDDFGDAALRIGQQLLGHGNPLALDIFPAGDIGKFLEHPEKMGFGIACHLCQP